MQNVPKIVRERLRVAQPAVNHIDADLLTAFAERSLPDRERTEVMEHLARCGDCRDVLALALPATESDQTATVPMRGRWLTWPALRWGFVTAGVVAIAAFGVLQYQRRQAAITAFTKPSQYQAAPTEARNQLSAPPFEKVDKAPAPAPRSATPKVPLLSEPKQIARIEAPASTHAPQVFGGTVGGQISNGPNASAAYQQQAQSQGQQAFMPTAPAASANRAASLSQPSPTPPISQTVEVTSAAPAPTIDTSEAQLSSTEPRRSLADESDSSQVRVGKAKPPVSQAALGQLGGFVVDPTGAVVANARITLTPSHAGEAATAVTNSRGAWLIAGLPAGSYKAQAEAPGFRTTVLAFNYDPNQPSTYSFTLSPGSASEVVEVAAAEAQVQTDSASIAGAITKSEVVQTPINGRNFTQLIALSPGANGPYWAINAVGALQRSFDKGRTWQSVDVEASPSSSANATSLQISAKTSRAKTRDTEKSLDLKSATLVFRAVAATGPDVWVGGSSGALFHSVDNGNNWTRVVPTSAGTILTGDIVSLEFSDLQNGKITTSAPEVWTTTDAGRSWQKQ